MSISLFLHTLHCISQEHYIYDYGVLAWLHQVHAAVCTIVLYQPILSNVVTCHVTPRKLTLLGRKNTNIIETISVLLFIKNGLKRVVTISEHAAKMHLQIIR